ncbi:MAG TPA: hypothetical protein DCS13_03510 [Candidatus Margulisbacteria bacterium]|nr:MAG: hypothetical protein A2X43_03605 [Candidatus Margulisbacteria bacterium GWD2_39_127]HAR62509.1 hypothetical protein [Candidatus Margulisiibacteriota bacterium]
MQRYVRYLQMITILVIITLAGFVRLANLGTQFTHVDDIGVAVTTLDREEKFFVHLEKASHKLEKKFNIHLVPLKTLTRWNINDNPVKNIISYIPNKIIQVHAIPEIWTYAPLQCAFVPFFINSSQSYRDIIFWGRFPAFLTSMVAIILLCVFSIALYGEKRFFPYLVAGLALFSFSWMHIIYSQQMENYVSGLIAIMTTLIILINIPAIETSRKKIFLSTCLIAFVCYLHYQLLFFLPAYWGCIVYNLYLREKGIVTVIKRLIPRLVVFSILIYPLIDFIMARNLGERGINWNTGPEKEFFFNILSAHGLLDRITYSIVFFTKNTFIVFTDLIAFMPEDTRFSLIIGTICFCLAGIGLFSCFRSTQHTKKMLGLFIVIASLTWIFLVLINKITISPTRHSLILLPLIIILISEGLGLAAGYFKRDVQSGLSISLAIMIIVVFFTNWTSVSKQRLDHFDEARIAQLLQKYQVSTIISYGWTWNIDLMNSISKKYNYGHINDCDFKQFDLMHGDISSDNFNHRAVAVISHRHAPDKRLYAIFKEQFSAEPVSTVYSDNIPSAKEIEFSHRTKNGTNGYYFNIIKTRSIPHNYQTNLNQNKRSYACK